MLSGIEWATSIRPGILKWVHDGWVSQQPDYKSITMMEKTNHAYEEYQSSTGVGIFAEVSKGESSPSQTLPEGYLQRITNRIYAATTEVRREDWERDRYGDVKKAATTMGAGVIQTYNYWSFNPLRGGFTSTVTYADAQEFFSTAHPRKDGGTAISNASSTSIPFTYANLETGKLALYDQVDDKGRVSTVGDGALSIVVPMDLEREAIVFTQSSQAASGNNNDINYYKGKFNVVSTKWLRSTIAAREVDGIAGSATAWYLMDSARQSLTFQLEQPLRVETDYHSRTRTAEYTGTTQFRVVPQNWRGWWGSKGDGSSYSG